MHLLCYSDQLESPGDARWPSHDGQVSLVTLARQQISGNLTTPVSTAISRPIIALPRQFRDSVRWRLPQRGPRRPPLDIDRTGTSIDAGCHHGLARSPSHVQLRPSALRSNPDGPHGKPSTPESTSVAFFWRPAGRVGALDRGQQAHPIDRAHRGWIRWKRGKGPEDVQSGTDSLPVEFRDSERPEKTSLSGCRWCRSSCCNFGCNCWWCCCGCLDSFGRGKCYLFLDVTHLILFSTHNYNRIRQPYEYITDIYEKFVNKINF